ncbi:MAG: mitochondrial fusion and transport protein ugo1 [Chaenotheca gracillima]|nr:MAG: mitochondrial fusion and transport protein ugo1 [Chaenotheca gracillima]
MAKHHGKTREPEEPKSRGVKRPKTNLQHRSSESSLEVDTPTEIEPEGASFKAVDLNDSDSIGSVETGDKIPSANVSMGALENGGDTSASEETDASSASESDNSSLGVSKKRKRNDPDAFATSISKILSSKLTTSKRADPVLARSRSAAEAGHELSEAKLEAKARRKLRDDKRVELDRGRVRDVLGVEEEKPGTAAENFEVEKRLRKTAQRGVVKLFNAVRAAQVKGEQAARDAKRSGVVGTGRREKQVNEMSKQGFLDLIASGGMQGKADALEEA